MLLGVQIQHKLRQRAVHDGQSAPFITTKREPVSLTAAAKSETSVHFAQRQRGRATSKSKLTRVPQRSRLQRCHFRLCLQARSSVRNVGMVSAISRISACRTSSSALPDPALRPVCSLPARKAQYLPRALSPGQWISIESYALPAGFRLYLQNFTTLFESAQLIYIQLKAPACQFSATASGSLRSRLGSSMLILCLSN